MAPVSTTVRRPVVVRLRGLTVFAHHGSVAEERALGQRFAFDVDLYLADCRACTSDSIDDTIGYEQIAELIVEVATRFGFRLLEALADAVCVELLEEFPAERARIVVSKPAPPMRYDIANVSVEVERERHHLNTEAS